MTNADKGFRIFAAVAVAVLVGVALVNLYQAEKSEPSAKIISYTQLLEDIEQNKLSSVTMVGQELRGVLIDHSIFRTYTPNDPELIKALRQKGVVISARAPADGANSLTPVLTTMIPMLLLVGVAIFFMRRMPGMGSRSSLGASKARLLSKARHRVTFGDVAGVDEARDSLQEIVDFLRSPDKFRRLGGKIPRGVLLVGPPGTGKTLLARAIAGEASVPFFTISGSDFVEMFVGIGAARVRALFEQAANSAPCIVFMDEIDAVGRRRGAGVGGGNDEREQTLNQLLVEMDGFGPNQGIILIAATNRPDVLDPALLRPGRFDREIVVHNPDVLGREQILAIHVRGVPLAADVNLQELARATPGFSGADLMNLVNEAALLAARHDKNSVAMLDFEQAKSTVMMGAERRTHVMSDEERRLTAYREGGRALVALFSPCADPIHTVTIVTRGRSSGLVKQVSNDDQNVMTLEQVSSRLAVLLGGRAAEELVFGRQKITSGTAAHIAEATKLARRTVTRWGFSETLGSVTYEENTDEVFLGNSMSRQQFMSDETSHAVALEVRKLIDAALADGLQILQAHRAELDAVARALMQRETLRPSDLRALISESR